MGKEWELSRPDPQRQTHDYDTQASCNEMLGVVGNPNLFSPPHNNDNLPPPFSFSRPFLFVCEESVFFLFFCFLIYFYDSKQLLQLILKAAAVWVRRKLPLLLVWGDIRVLKRKYVRPILTPIPGLHPKGVTPKYVETQTNQPSASSSVKSTVAIKKAGCPVAEKN